MALNPPGAVLLLDPGGRAELPEQLDERRALDLREPQSRFPGAVRMVGAVSTRLVFVRVKLA
jgi:hypothetical protein